VQPSAPANANGAAKPKEYDHPDHVKGARIIRGRVIAEDAIPVPGAWVTAAVDYRPAADAICDKNGEFVIVVPGDMPITLSARARQTSEVAMDEIPAEPGQVVTVVLSKRDRGTLRGICINSGGGPVAGATVTLKWEEPEDGNPPLNDDGEPDLIEDRTTLTDKQGGFRFPGIWAGSGGGDFVVAAKHPRHYAQAARLRADDPYRLPHEIGGVQLTLLDAAGGVAKGRLVNEKGKPIPSAHVMGLVRDGRTIIEWKRFEVVNGVFEAKFQKSGQKVVLTPVVNNRPGIPIVIPDLESREKVEITYKPAPPLLTGKLIPPPGGGLLETQFALEITSGQIASPVANPAVKFDPVTGQFTFVRQFYGIEGGAAYGTLTIKAPGCKPKTVDFNAYDGETEDLGEIELEAE
jgi:hypothetical protein